MKRMLFGVLVLRLLGAGLPAEAGSPAMATVAVSAGSTNAVGSGSLAVSFGSGVGFRTEAVVMPAAAGSTQTVYFVFGGVTNAMGSMTAGVNDCVLSLTNAPWLFDGDGVVITTTGTNGFSARVVGSMRR